MPEFFFNLYNDVDVPDLEGQEFPDLQSATQFAAEQMRALAGEDIQHKGGIVLGHHIDIEDESGTVLATVRLGDVVTIKQ